MAVTVDSEKTKASLKKMWDKKEAPKEENKLVVNRDPEGTYYLSWENGGVLPDSLKGRFTSIAYLEKAVEIKYGTLDILA